MRKLVAKDRLGPRVLKRYDEPRTSYQRLLESSILTSLERQELRGKMARINPGRAAATHRPDPA